MSGLVDWSSKSGRTWLSGAEGDDPADGIVGGDADGDAIARDDLDAEAPHPPAQLREHFMARITLHSIQPPGMDRDDGPLHIYKIVFAQSAHPFTLSNDYATQENMTK